MRVFVTILVYGKNITLFIMKRFFRYHNQSDIAVVRLVVSDSDFMLFNIIVPIADSAIDRVLHHKISVFY